LWFDSSSAIVRAPRCVVIVSLVHGAEMRVAETRAVNRALRKAYDIGICWVEEIGAFAEPVPFHLTLEA
jgi:hypothetical protein